MKKILLCLDTDTQPSVFDAVVALDAGANDAGANDAGANNAGADHLLRHGGVRPADVEPLVHGAIFTRGPADLKHTAVFIGGSSIAAAEALRDAVVDCYFGPLRCSVLLDPSGANTTAAAAVVAAGRHATLDGTATATVLGAGPVGQRVAWLLADCGVDVRLASPDADQTAAACSTIDERIGNKQGRRPTPIGLDRTSLVEAVAGAQILVAAGPAGVRVLDQQTLAGCDTIRVAIDLNAVPPAGVEGIESADKAVARHGQTHYGALGVGGLKTRIHKAAIRRLFETNDQVLDAPQVLAVGRSLPE